MINAGVNHHPPMARVRKIKIAVLYAARAVGVFASARLLTRRAPRILCYHGVWLGHDGFGGDAMFMRAETFAARLDAIRTLGYPVIPLAKAVDAVAGRDKLHSASVAITIDDGWFSTYAAMIPALARHKMPATLYCDTANLMSGAIVTNVAARYLADIKGRALSAAEAELLAFACDKSNAQSVREGALQNLADSLQIDLEDYRQRRVFDYMTPDELRDAHKGGLDVQLHTHNHVVKPDDAAQITSEIAANRRALADILGGDCNRFEHFCYPSGVASQFAANVIRIAGLASSTTTVHGLATPGSDLHLLPRQLDGEQLSAIEFEAELSGFSDIVRMTARFAGTCIAKINRIAADLSRAKTPTAGSVS